MIAYIIFYFLVYSPLIILCTYFKITLRMIAYRAYLWSLCSDYNMSTVTAFPYLHFALLKHLSSFNVLKKCTISLLMVLFNFSYCSKFCC